MRQDWASRRRLALGTAVAAVVAVTAAAFSARARAAGADGDGVVTLRIASVAPKGSTWGNDINVMARDIERATDGKVKVKLYLSGAAGDELQMAERVKKGQLDGVISGGWLCNQTMPSMRALSLIGVFQSREEAAFVANELRPELEQEAARAGFTLVGTAGLGSIVIFSRDPINSMADLRKTKLWRWEGEAVQVRMGEAMGLTTVTGKLEQAAKLYDEGKVDGFFAVPMAALAFQWFAGTRYITELRTGYLMGCFLLSNQALDRLTPEHRQAIHGAGAALVVRVEDAGRRQDDALMGGIYEKQGLKKLPVSERFRAEFFEAARKARDEVAKDLVPEGVLAKVLQMLADYRSEHR